MAIFRAPFLAKYPPALRTVRPGWLEYLKPLCFNEIHVDVLLQKFRSVIVIGPEGLDLNRGGPKTTHFEGAVKTKCL